MKRLTPFLLGTLFGVLVLAAFTLGQVSASSLAATGCFSDTNGHWGETFICWAAENGIVSGFPGGTFRPDDNVTRAQAAVMLQLQADVPPSTGEHYFNVGPNAWQPNANYSANAYVRPFTIQAHLRSNNVATQKFQVTPTLPSTVYGHYTFFKGVLLCYKQEGTAYITDVEVRHEKFFGGLGTTTTLNLLTDTTDRTGYACRMYEFSSPSSYYPDNIVSLVVGVTFPDTAGYMRIYSTTFVLEPSLAGPGYIYDEIDTPSMPGLLQEANPDVQPDYGPESGE